MSQRDAQHITKMFTLWKTEQLLSEYAKARAGNCQKMKNYVENIMTCTKMMRTEVETQEFDMVRSKIFNSYTSKSARIARLKSTAGFELNKNMHMYHAFDNHIYSFSCM